METKEQTNFIIRVAVKNMLIKITLYIHDRLNLFRFKRVFT